MPKKYTQDEFNAQTDNPDNPDNNKPTTCKLVFTSNDFSAVFNLLDLFSFPLIRFGPSDPSNHPSLWIVEFFAHPNAPKKLASFLLDLPNHQNHTHTPPNTPKPCHDPLVTF